MKKNIVLLLVSLYLVGCNSSVSTANDGGSSDIGDTSESSSHEEMSSWVESSDDGTLPEQVESSSEVFPSSSLVEELDSSEPEEYSSEDESIDDVVVSSSSDVLSSEELLSSSLEEVSSSAEELSSSLAEVSFSEKYGAPEGSPVALHGFLTRDGTVLVDEHGVNTQLIGVSLFWTNWQGQFFNRGVVQWLADDWKIDIIRAPLGIDHTENGDGYLQNPSLKDKVIEVIDAAIEAGIYVIVDWHDHRAYNHTEQARAFLTEIAQTYGSHPNIVYEIFNEPTQSGSGESQDNNYDWGRCEQFMDGIIKDIRQYDTKNHIIVGSGDWSSTPGAAAASFNEGRMSDPNDNVSLSMHFYAAEHKEGYREKAQAGIDGGYPVFASEWGTADPGNKQWTDEESTRTWVTWMKERGVSWTTWAISAKDEPNSLLKPHAGENGGWSDGDLTDGGRLIRGIIREVHGL
ncbi:MAG: glycoside hydrolase family 5 protein [Fibrobacterales bacterium]